MIQEGCLERLGGSESIRSTSASWRRPTRHSAAPISDGRFRKDLELPTQRRDHCPAAASGTPEDIPGILAHYFLFRFNRQLGTAVHSIVRETLELLESYPWPGNVRELLNASRQARSPPAGTTILPDSLPAELHEQTGCEEDDLLQDARSPRRRLADSPGRVSMNGSPWVRLICIAGLANSLTSCCWPRWNMRDGNCSHAAK